jgi:hypothetical protein
MTFSNESVAISSIVLKSATVGLGLRMKLVSGGEEILELLSVSPLWKVR